VYALSLKRRKIGTTLIGRMKMFRSGTGRRRKRNMKKRRSMRKRSMKRRKRNMRKRGERTRWMLRFIESPELSANRKKSHYH